MTREIIEITSEDQWLQLRTHDLTSTAISALFDLSPYCTKFEVYHAKKSGLILPFDENERVKKGKRIESYVAQEVGLKMGWEVQPLNVYARIPGERMGSSFDYEAICPVRGKGILEIKGVDYFQHKAKWLDDEAPEHIEIQLQHQLECIDEYEWGCISACTSIYDTHEYIRERDHDMGLALRTAANKFWADVDAGNEPAIDFYRDGPVLDLLYSKAGGEPIDATKDEELDALISKHVRLGREIKAMDADRDAAKAQIHRRLENAGGAYTAGGKVTCGWTKDSVGKLVTEEMVGTYIGAKKGYRQCLTKIMNEEK
jgi:putative phage-type endonuclease